MDRGMIAAYAAEHHGVLPMWFLETAGVSSRHVRRLVQEGEWRRIHEGVFAVAAVVSSFELRATAALAAIPGAVLSHHSAAELHGLEVGDERIHLTVPPGARNRLEDAMIHQSAMPAPHVSRRRGMIATNIERTILDLAAVLSTTDLQRCVEDLLLSRRTTLARLESMYLELAPGRRAGLVRARSVLADIDGRPPTESELERQFLGLVDRHGLPRPMGQVRFEWAPREKGRVDFFYASHQLIVELDGRRFHLRAAAFERDRRRDQIALVNGMRTIRFTHLQLAGEAAFVADIVTMLLMVRPSG